MSDPLFKPRGESGAGVAFIRRQRLVANAVAEEIEAREEHGPVGNGDCGLCHTRLPYLELFRCFFCLTYICSKCAEKHFGKSREQYWKEKE